jgi:hypothetical protein
VNEYPIGGYFSLERKAGTPFSWIKNAVGYQSARSAIAAALIAQRPTTVWVPNFICGAINDTLRTIDAKVRTYALTESLDVSQEVNIAPTDLLVCVDYFGTNATAVAAAIARFGAKRVLIDASQSLFLAPVAGCTTVYSPRKFLGLPDGGLILTSMQLAPRRPATETDSIARSQHLLYRLADLTEMGFAKFKEAEKSLAGCESIAMSQLTRNMFASIDLEAVSKARVSNYQRLAALLRETGFDVPNLPTDAVPLCCPVNCEEATHVRSKLAAFGIFTPTFWPDSKIPDEDTVALKLRDRTIYLPCDQRYDEPDLTRIAKKMLEAVEAR